MTYTRMIEEKYGPYKYKSAREGKSVKSIYLGPAGGKGGERSETPPKESYTTPPKAEINQSDSTNEPVHYKAKMNEPKPKREIAYRKQETTQEVFADQPLSITKKRWQSKNEDINGKEFWEEGADFIEVDGLVLSEADFEAILDKQDKNELTEEEAIEVVREYGNIEKRKIAEEKAVKRGEFEAEMWED